MAASDDGGPMNDILPESAENPPRHARISARPTLVVTTRRDSASMG
jgi:hypothetical protein